LLTLVVAKAFVGTIRKNATKNDFMLMASMMEVSMILVGKGLHHQQFDKTMRQLSYDTCFATFFSHLL